MQDHGVSARHNQFGTFQVKIEQKTERAYAQHGKRSPQKVAAVTKFKGAHLLKWLAALCVMECVGAEGVSSSARGPFRTPLSTCCWRNLVSPRPSPTPAPTPSPPTQEAASFGASP